MKKTLYIANRGEIALRVMRTARRLGYRIAVGFAEPDRDLPFVEEADEAIDLEGEEPRETYLNILKVIAAAKRADAHLIHPGYGFLSENALFVDAVIQAGMKFVGPSSPAMSLLGNKISARKLAQKEGVNVLPSYDGEDQSIESLTMAAQSMGFPLLAKPANGGGGKGMTRLYGNENFSEVFASAKRVAENAFNDSRLFLERLIEPARHIEAQMIADSHGTIHCLGIRECSLQRRHQKILEETPCIKLNEALEVIVRKQSTTLLRAAKYENAATVEWIWDGKDQAFFLEVNTRLQVEHPVTEMISGVDLVEWQLKVAEGEALPSEAPKLSGHAIEARICAEDPEQDFLPSGGKIHRLSLPKNIRCDFGYREKNIVPGHFDSLIGKVIAKGADRDEAIQNLIGALEDLVLMGPKTNRAYLIQILKNKRIQKSDLHTQLLEELPYRFDSVAAMKALKDLKQNPSFSRAIADAEDRDLYSPWGPPITGFETSSSSDLRFEDFGDKRYFWTRFADWTGERPGWKDLSQNTTEGDSHSLELRCPMPARIVKILVAAGETVKKDQGLFIIEAMKMEQQIRASREAKVKEVLVSEGMRAQVDQILLNFEPDV